MSICLIGVPPAICLVNKIAFDKCSIEAIDVREVDDRLETRAVVVFGGRRFFNGSECPAESIDVIIVEGLSAEE